MRICDYIAEYLYSIGIKYIHGITGGGAAGLNDGFAKHGKLEYISYHHEQCAGFAALGESKYNNKLSVVNPTTGCGGTNCITPLLAAWQDSVPILFLSGNVSYKHTAHFFKKYHNLDLRKFGIQENNIIENVKNITKYSTIVEKPEDAIFELQKAIHIATSERFGPVWLDIPSDIQGAKIEKEKLKLFEPKHKDYIYNWDDSKGIKELKEDLKKYQRPLVIAGNGIRLSNSQEQFRQFIEEYQLPFAGTYLGFNLMDCDSKFNIGRLGIKGDRAGNFAINNADLLLILGCSLGISHIGYNPNLFAPKAKKYLVDIEKNKQNIVKIDEFIRCDLGKFFKYML